jgi:hypothetical protein
MHFVASGLLALTASVHLSASEAASPDIPAKVFAMCPGAEREASELEARLKPSHAPLAPERPALRENLLLMARQDQEARMFTHASGLHFDLQDPAVRRMNDVDAANLRRLKQIVEQESFPTARMVGLDGVDAAWLLTIHASSDPDFQEKVLKLTTGHVRRGEVRSDQVAVLIDDLLAGRGKPQRYGTNFEMRDGELKPAALEDEARVEELRREAGLGTLANYACLMRALYGAPETQRGAPLSDAK